MRNMGITYVMKVHLACELNWLILEKKEWKSRYERSMIKECCYWTINSDIGDGVRFSRTLPKSISFLLNYNSLGMANIYLERTFSSPDTICRGLIHKKVNMLSFSNGNDKTNSKKSQPYMRFVNEIKHLICNTKDQN